MKSQQIKKWEKNKEIKNENQKEKKKIKTFFWRSRLDPCSTRILTICSKPFSAAKWRAVFPFFNKKKVVKKRIKTKSNITAIHKATRNNQQWNHKQQRNKKQRNKNEKENEKTFFWRSRLDPCSTRILTICSKPLKAAKWRTVHPFFNKKKVVKKKE